MNGRVIEVVAAGGLLFAAAARAQSPLRIEVVPRAAMYLPRNELGPAAPAGGAWFLHLERMDAAPAFEMEVRVLPAGSPLSLRLVGLATLPAEAPGFFNCYPGLACPAVLLESTAEVSVLGAAADLVWSPLGAASPVRPFLLLGAGVKRYHYSWPAPAVLVEAGEDAESAFAAHAGAGLEFAVLGQSIRVEVADWWSGEGAAIGDDPGVAGFSAPRRRQQHDVAVSIGWRLLRI